MMSNEVTTFLNTPDYIFSQVLTLTVLCDSCAGCTVLRTVSFPAWCIYYVVTHIFVISNKMDLPLGKQLLWR